jgi:hypothetical protein
VARATSSRTTAILDKNLVRLTEKDGSRNRESTGTGNGTAGDSMTSELNEVLLRVVAPDGQRILVLEDNGRVAYAYLLDGDLIIGDVWLYNVDEDPEGVDWQDRSAMPFCNPAKYCSAEALPRLRPDSKVSCVWSAEGVTVFIAGIAWARLERGRRPGWSRKARFTGPLAMPLSLE